MAGGDRPAARGRDRWRLSLRGDQHAVRAVVSAGAPASQRGRGRLGREPTGRADDVRERPALAHRRRARRSGSSRTMPHLARSCGPPGARWPPRARWRAGTVSCRSSRYARTGRTGAGETTILRWPGTRRSRSRWAAWLGRLLAMCSRWLPSWPSPAPHRLLGTTIGSIRSWPAPGPHGRPMTPCRSGVRWPGLLPATRLRDRCSSTGRVNTLLPPDQTTRSPMSSRGAPRAVGVVARARILSRRVRIPLP